MFIKSKEKFYKNNRLFNIFFLKRILNIGFFSFLFIVFTGYVTLYSINDSFKPWAYKHIIYTLITIPIFVLIISLNLKVIKKYSYLTYLLSIVLLLVVNFKGKIGLGAKRWIDLYFFTIQPSEIAKISLVLTLGKYYNDLKKYNHNFFMLIVVPFLIASPIIALVAIQPDLATSVIIFGIVAIIVFIFIPDLKLLLIGIVGFIALCPVIWFNLKDYQKHRILNFIEPERDALGTGYNVIQSKIAIGSGGFFGKGYLQGTQGNLKFLPEHHSDFIFTMIAEQFGFFGSVIVILAFFFLIKYGYSVIDKTRSIFGKITALGITSIFFIHTAINIGMTCGLIPVAGIPLPMISFGGTVLITSIISFAILLNIDVNYDVD